MAYALLRKEGSGGQGAMDYVVPSTEMIEDEGLWLSCCGPADAFCSVSPLRVCAAPLCSFVCAVVLAG